MRTTPAASVLRASVEKPAGAVGVAQPVIVRLHEPVKGAAARSAVLSRLQVTTASAVQGAWRWYNSYEVHYRAATYWTSGTTVGVTADIAKHTRTVTRDGKLL